MTVERERVESNIGIRPKKKARKSLVLEKEVLLKGTRTKRIANNLLSKLVWSSYLRKRRDN